MASAPFGQQNLYKGIDPRSWIRVELEASDGARISMELIADTGCPFNMIVDVATLQRYALLPAPPISTTFGQLVGAWLRIIIPEVSLDVRVLAYANDSVVQDVKVDCPDFGGLIGLPLLRMMEYGGDADWFWIRPAQASGTPGHA
jgi:hypothetical protein